MSIKITGLNTSIRRLIYVGIEGSEGDDRVSKPRDVLTDEELEQRIREKFYRAQEEKMVSRIVENIKRVRVFFHYNNDSSIRECLRTLKIHCHTFYYDLKKSGLSVDDIVKRPRKYGGRLRPSFCPYCGDKCSKSSQRSSYVCDSCDSVFDLMYKGKRY